MKLRNVTLHTAAALTIAIFLVGGLGTLLLIREVRRTYEDLQTESNRQQASRLRSFLEQQLRSGADPYQLLQRLQTSLVSSVPDPSGFFCLLGEEGEVLCHPDSQTVGMSIGDVLVRNLRGEIEGTVASRLDRRAGGAGALSGMSYGGSDHIVYQLPVAGQPWLVSVHSNRGRLEERAIALGRSVVMVALPIGLLLALFGTIAARCVTRAYERRIEAANALLEARVAERTEELHQTVEELRNTHSTMLQNEKMALIGQIMSGLMHELNNPLTSIIGQAQLGLRRESRTEDRARFVHIHAAGERCLHLVRNLLSFARRNPPDRALHDLNAIIESAHTLIEGEMERSGVRFELRLAAGLPPILADGLQVEQVVLNLANNARQALEETGRGGVVTVTTQVRDGHIVVTIADDGPGIPGTILGRLFEPFHTTKPEGAGTGLGLSLCSRFVRAHGGEIALRSTGPEGTCFEVILPAAEQPGELAA